MGRSSINGDYIPVVPARGGAEVALELTIRPFSSIELTRALHLPGPCVRALCELVGLFLSKNMTSVRPRCGQFLHTSHCTLQTQHFILHTCTSHPKLHLISNHLISSHLMSPHLSSSQLSHPFSHVI